MEHGATGNNVEGDYVGTTFYYLDRPEGEERALAAVGARAVREPRSFTIVPGWQEPVFAFSFQNATLTKVRERVQGRDVRALVLRQTGPAEMLDHFVAVTAEAPAAGRYAVYLEGLEGPEEGVVQMLVNGQSVGERVDFYAAGRGVRGEKKMLEMEMEQGPNPLFFGLAGRNEASKGLGFALVKVRCERVR